MVSKYLVTYSINILYDPVDWNIEKLIECMLTMYVLNTPLSTK